MGVKSKFRSVSMSADLIAPCGINCALCSGYQRIKNTCPGCNALSGQPSYCRDCSIKMCSKKTETTQLCIECSGYPCRRLKQLEKRYREKYGEHIFSSMEQIQNEGIIHFLEREQTKWTCSCGELLCVHNELCEHCGRKNDFYIRTKKAETGRNC